MSQDTLYSVRISCRTSRWLENCVAQLSNVRVEQFGLCTIYIRGSIFVALITSQYVNRVSTEVLHVGQQVLLVESKHTICLYRSLTTHSCELTIVWVEGHLVTATEVSQSNLSSSFQAIIELSSSREVTSKHIVLTQVLIQSDSRSRVRLVHEGTHEVSLFSISIVIHSETVVVFHDQTISITDVERIDRSHEVAEEEQVTR